MTASSSEAALRARLVAAADSDQLAPGPFDEIEQEWVRIGKFWVGLDERLPWQLSQYFRENRTLLSGLRLRLNVEQIHSVDGHASPLRKARWWGAPFRWERLESYRGPVVAVHADPSKPLHQLSHVEQVRFRWNVPSDQNIAVLQIEEFADGKVTPGGTRSTKYLHSILDLELRKFKHLDGAIKTYSPEMYMSAYSGLDLKAGTYEKLFRTDDEFVMGDDTWMNVVATFFANNELVREYFGGE